MWRTPPPCRHWSGAVEHDANYIAELRRFFRSLYFPPRRTRRHRPHPGQQLSALLPGAKRSLHPGPSESLAAQQRYAGVLKPNRGRATARPEGPLDRIERPQDGRSWLQLSTSRQSRIEAVCAQDDSMAIGARRPSMNSPKCATSCRGCVSRVRWAAQDWTGLGAARLAHRDDFHSAECGLGDGVDGENRLPPHAAARDYFHHGPVLPAVELLAKSASAHA